MPLYGTSKSKKTGIISSSSKLSGVHSVKKEDPQVKKSVVLQKKTGENLPSFEKLALN